MALIKHAQSRDIARDAVVLDLGSIRQEAAKLRARAQAQAQRIVEQAHEERQRLISDAHEIGLAQGKAQGLKEGTEQGKAHGRAQAIESYQEKLDSLVSTLNEMLDAYEASRASLADLAREDVLRFAISVAQRVTKRAVELDSDAALHQLQAALALVLNPTKLQIAVHPDDASTIQDALPDLLNRFNSDVQAKLLEDDSIAKGSAVIRTEQGMVHADVEHQLERILDLVRPGPVGDTKPDAAP